MAVTAVTPNQLVVDTLSDDLNFSDGVTATSQTDGWAIALGAYGVTHNLLACLLDDGSGSTVTVKAGDQPPAMRAALGDLTLTLAASDARFLMISSGRYEQNDGTINIVATDAGCKILTFLTPKARTGGTAVT